jgi:predicted tellurium resistance membrane protein TerC
MLHDVKQKLNEIRRKQRTASAIILVGVALFVLGFFLALLFLVYAVGAVFNIFGLLISLVGLGVWLYYSSQKTNVIKELKTHLAMEALKTRSGEHEDWELIQELLSD